jgi:Cu+-exporting ATPase
VFVPIVITIAVIATIIWLLLGYPFEFALSIGISVLVISCPCALGLATPVSIMVGTGKAAENGILIKSAESLELAHSINAIVLDKTGTITVGKPQVNDIFVFNKMQEGELLKIVGAIESKSEHPIAKAILEKTKEVEALEAQNFEAIEGKGIKASINSNTYFAGNESLMKENNIKLSEAEGIYQKLYEQAKTVIFVSDDEKLLGIIAISDTVKQTSIEAINGFKDLKIETYMLTGDNKTSAQAIGKMVGIDNIISEVLPQEKESKVRSLQEQGKIVAMIGDRNK